MLNSFLYIPLTARHHDNRVRLLTTTTRPSAVNSPPTPNILISLHVLNLMNIPPLMSLAHEA